jgi:phytoene synthase
MVPMNEMASETIAVGDLDHVESVVRRSGTSFYWAMRILPEEKRRAMFAVYAFCREVDDIADDPGEVPAKLIGLGRWRDEVERLYDRAPRLPISRALLGPVQRFGLRKADFLAVIDGMEMDAADRLRIADMDELILYCDRVACAVGRLSNRVFGVDEPSGYHLARALGQALQLTNILRDLDEDARRDRLYLPEDMLSAQGVIGTEDACQVLREPAVAAVCERIAEIARERFTEAAAILAKCNRRDTRPAMIMMEVYRRTLRRLMFRGWRRWAEPVSVSPAEKLWVALRYGMI